MTKPWLSIEGISRRYGARAVFQDVWFGVERGEFVVLIGHSGCGKTTILNILAGLEAPEAGVIVLDGHEISGPSLDRAVIFQSHALMPWLSALGNVAFAVRERNPGWTRAHIRDHARGVLRLAEMSHRRRRGRVRVQLQRLFIHLMSACAATRHPGPWCRASWHRCSSWCSWSA